MALSSKSTGQYLYQAAKFRLETRDIEQLAPDEVQVAIRATTLCGSDLHYYQHFRNGDILVREPLCLGHESAGDIVAVGPGVTNLCVGDRVALEVGVPCDTCEHCHSGRYNICPQLRFRSSGSKFPHYQGTLQQLVNHPAKWVHKLPPELEFEIGALLEPLSVAIQAVRRVEKHVQSAAKGGCLIFGAGAIGLLLSVAARVAGLRNVVMADVDDGRLQFARDNGFASVVYKVKPRRGDTNQEKLSIAREVAIELGGQAWNDGSKLGKIPLVFECTGVESCLQASIYAAKSGGSVVLIGLGVPIHTLPISEATTREIDLIPTWRYANTYSEAIQVATASIRRTGQYGAPLPDLQKLITHRYKGLDNIDEAFRVAGKTKDETGLAVLKTVITT